MAAIVAFGVLGTQPTQAQGPFPGRPSISVQAFNACTTTNYADIIAKTLNTTSATLRKDIVAGQQLQDIATAANVDIKTVVDAYQTARKADIDQAVKDGVITQDEATALEATPGAPGTPPAPRGNGQGGNGQGGPGGGNGPRGNGGAGGFAAAQAAPFPDISNIRLLLQPTPATQAAPGSGQGGGGQRGGFGPGGFGGGIGLGLGNGVFNLVKQYAVAATALNVKCADLVKTLITPPGTTITAVAATQKVDPATVSAALTKAYADALAQDVTDGTITQAQSDQLTPLVTKAVTTFVSNPYVMGRQGPPATPAQ